MLEDRILKDKRSSLEQKRIILIQNEFAKREKERCSQFTSAKKSYENLCTRVRKQLLKIENHERQLTAYEGTIKKKLNVKVQELDMLIKRSASETKFQKNLQDKKYNEVLEKLKDKNLFIKKLEKSKHELEKQYFELKRKKLNTTESSLVHKISELETEKYRLGIDIANQSNCINTLEKELSRLKQDIASLRQENSTLKEIESQRQKNQIANLEFQLMAKTKQKQLQLEKQELNTILEDINSLQTKFVKEAVSSS